MNLEAGADADDNFHVGCGGFVVVEEEFDGLRFRCTRCGESKFVSFRDL